MRPAFLLLSLFLCSTTMAQLRFGFTGGLQSSNITVRSEREDPITLPQLGNVTGALSGTTHALLTYYGGLVVDQGITSELSIRMKLLFNLKGWKENAQFQPSDPSSPTYSYQETYKISYLQAPLYLQFRPAIGKNHLLIGIGPYFGFAVDGRYRFRVKQTSDNNIKDSVDMIAVNSYQSKRALLHANNFEFGFSVLAGIEFRSGLFLDASLNAGMKNIMTDRYLGFPNRYLVFSLGTGYFLHK